MNSNKKSYLIKKKFKNINFKKNKEIKEMNKKNIDLTIFFNKKIDKILLEYANKIN